MKYIIKDDKTFEALLKEYFHCESQYEDAPEVNFSKNVLQSFRDGFIKQKENHMKKFLSIILLITFSPVVLILSIACLAGIVLLLLYGWGLILIGGWGQKYVQHIALGIDQLGNTLMAGDEDETMSSRAGRRWPNSWWVKFINVIFWWQNSHCINAIESGEKFRNDII